jgi:hypothetical protein
VESSATGLACLPPRYRCPLSGEWTPCLGLPDALRDALADAVLKETVLAVGMKLRWNIVQ